MDNILKRNDFVKDIYDPMIERKEYERLVSVNEGLLSRLFGAVKNLFKRDWDTIKGDREIIRVYKELDDALTGFSTMKMRKKDECNQIRQALVDFASDWYQKKMSEARNDDTDPVPAKSTNFKDRAMRENLESMEKKIKDIAGNDGQMKKWADILKDEMKVVINRSILSEIENEETRKEIERKNKEELQKREEINKEMEKFQNEQLEEIRKERNRLIRKTDSNPDFIKDDLLGDKAVQNICGEFDKIRKTSAGKKRNEMFKKDSVFGFRKLFPEKEYGTDKFNLCYDLMDSFYNSLGARDVMEKFKDTPGPSVHAMCIAVNSFIKNCVYGGNDYGDDVDLMARCAIISDGTVSYNLPSNGKEGDDAGNYFTEITSVITSGKLKYTNDKRKVIKLPDDFSRNAKTLLNKITSEAKKLKERSEELYNKKMSSYEKLK